MKTKCSICGEPIENKPHLEVESTGCVFHTCNQNSDGNTCYQEWLSRPREESLSSLEEGMGSK